MTTRAGQAHAGVPSSTPKVRNPRNGTPAAPSWWRAFRTASPLPERTARLGRAASRKPRRFATLWLLGLALLLPLAAPFLGAMPASRAFAATGEPGEETLPPEGSSGSDLSTEEASSPALPPEEDAAFKAVPVAGPFHFPWGFAFLPDGGILVTEREEGRLRLVTGGEIYPDGLQGVPEVLAGEHAGLLDVLLDPEFAANRTLYLSYTVGRRDALSLRILRAELAGRALVHQEVIFESRPPAPGLTQLGGRLAFGADGMLYLTLGDRFQEARAQDLRDHAGSIIRIRPDGGIPADNPFAGRPDALPEIYSYGHRNPQGLALEHSTGRLWSTEHGPKGGDELNIIEAGQNYGWPFATFGVGYDGVPISASTWVPGTVLPVHHWTPSVAPSSLAYYDGVAMPAAWRGNLLVGTLAGETLIRLELTPEGRIARETRLLTRALGRIRDVGVAPGGFVYLLTDGPDGALYRLEPEGEEVASRRATP